MPNIFTPFKTIQLARLWHQQHHKIVFVNGCFDVLHLGHLHLLDTAKRAGTRLIIAVNDDAYCRRRKGPTRPIQPAEVRVRAAAGVIDAHAACIFDDDSPADLLYGIQPHIYMLGSDYQDAPVIGSHHCEQVWFVARLPGHSTTGLLGK